ncbi:VanW family protein [Anaerolineales bacterium HSG6]|nr:VanW family protein [Anaerolineales bacterium HSG6]
MSQIIEGISYKLNQLQSLWIPLLFVLTTGTILLLALFTVLGYQTIYINRTYPGVFIADIDVSGMPPTEMTTVLETRTSEYLARSVTINVENEQLVYTGQELGLRVDTSLTANKAYAIGRSGNLLTDLLTHLTLLIRPHTVEPIIVYDSGTTDQIVQQLADQYYQAPQDARFVIDGTGQVTIVPSQLGQQIHVETTQADIEQAIFSQNPQIVTVVTQKILPTVRELDLETARQQAVTLLAQPLRLGYQHQDETVQWQLEPQSLATMIKLVKTVDGAGKKQFSIAFEETTTKAYLEQLAVTIQIEPINAKLVFDDEANSLQVVQPSQSGRQLDMENSYQAITRLAQNPSEYVPLTVIFTSPPIDSDNLEALGIKEVVGESTSYFYGSSQGRMNNIELAASKFNGVIIPPGELFSFNHYLGPVTAENGYDESLIIGAERTAVGIGGGVCQVSTTVFRAALFTGFEIVERWAHGYRVGWYETNATPGLDATIYTPDVDFKFRNDTDYHLLIQTETDLDISTITFRFYSTHSGRDVVVSSPHIENEVKHGPPIYEEDSALPRGAMEQIDWAKDGLDVTVYRTVSEGDTVLHEDVVFSRYRPWQAVYKVGPGVVTATPPSGQATRTPAPQ